MSRRTLICSRFHRSICRRRARRCWREDNSRGPTTRTRPGSRSRTTLLVVRSGRDPQQLTAAIRESVRGLDAALPLMIGTRESGLEALLFGPRMATITLGVLGMMGAMLSITGIFGMAAYSVSKRLRELGIRMALGAQ